MNKVIYVPVTPAGTALFDLQAKTEQGAWDKLMHAASHIPYKTKENFIKRGYTVISLKRPTKVTKVKDMNDAVTICFTEEQLRVAAVKFIRHEYNIHPHEMEDEVKTQYYLKLGILIDFVTTLIEDHQTNT